MADSVTGSLPAWPGAGPAGLTQVVVDLDLRDVLIERGTSGLRRPGGFVREEWLPELSGAQGIRTYRKMADNSPVIGACLYAITMRMRNVHWTMQPANETEEARAYADLVAGMLFDDLEMPWDLLLSEILSFLIYGYSYFELVYKRRLGPQPGRRPDGTALLPSKFEDGLIGFGKVAPRAQETTFRWEFDATGSLLGMHQIDPWMGRHAYLPYEKALLFRPMSYKDSPEGRSILRTAYRPWYMLTQVENTEGIGIERDLAGLPTFGVPPQWFSGMATPEEVAQLEAIKRIGRNLRVDEQACLIYPLIYDPAGNQLFRFDLAHAGGAKAIDTDKIIQRYELRITQSMLCDLLFMGHEDVGSFALASSKSTTEAVALGGYLTVIQDEMNRRALPKLWQLNAFPDALMPRLAHGDVESLDLTELARFMLSFGRIFPMRDLENHIRSIAGLPERPGAEQHPLPPAIQPMHQEHEEGAPGGGRHEPGGAGAGLPGAGVPDIDRLLGEQPRFGA